MAERGVGAATGCNIMIVGLWILPCDATTAAEAEISSKSSETLIRSSLLWDLCRFSDTGVTSENTFYWVQTRALPRCVYIGFIYKKSMDLTKNK
jgi:hypothetical protein